MTERDKKDILRTVKKGLEKKQVELFEKRRRGDRKTDRRFVQITDTLDELKKQSR